MPEVSVVIPTYNAAGSVVQAVESVLTQTHRDIEVIVVDDGSTDDTGERLAACRGRIRYFRQENRGRAAARNAGMRYARGEYVAFLDADDYWLPTKISKQVGVMQSCRRVGMVYSRAYAVDRHGRRLHPIGQVHARSYDIADNFCRLLLGNFIPSPTPVVRRECIGSVGSFDRSVRGEDHDYWLRIARQYPIVGLDEPLACYRVTGPSLLRKIATRDAQGSAVRIVEKHVDADICAQEVLRLALALAWLTGAVIDWGLGHVQEGRWRLGKALEIEPGLLTTRVDAAVWLVADLALQLCEGEDTAEAGEQLVTSVWGALPSGLSDRAHMRDALSRLHAARLFNAGPHGDRHTVLHSLIPMLRNDPRRVCDRGVWSTVLRALVRGDGAPYESATRCET